MWGPSARRSIRFAEEPEAICAHEQDVFQVASELIKGPSHFITFKSPSATHRIFVVRPSPKSRRIAIAEFGTTRLRDIFARVYINQDCAVRQGFYRSIRDQPLFASLAGQIFKNHVLLWLWHSNVAPTCTCATANSPYLDMSLCRDNLKFFYKAEELKGISEPKTHICLVPTSQTFPTLDAVILTSSAVITVQITIALKHDADEQEFNLIYRNLPPDLLAKRPGRYHVFITDNDINARSLREQNHTQIPDGTLVYSTARCFEDLDYVTEERMYALDKARVSLY